MNALSVFGLTGWILAGLGSALILLGLLARRIVVHTSPHCAKCKYPLADVPTSNNQTTCPECGQVPKNPTETYTMRSKRWCIPLGILLFAAALILPHTHSIRSTGWTSVLPISSQINLWPKGDPKLRDRIYNAYAAGDLTTSQNTKLHTVLMQAFTDPESSAPDAAALMDYLRHGMNGTSIFTEADCANGILNGSELVQKAIVTFISRQLYGTPQTPELREARRSVIRSTTDDSNQRNTINWLITSPTDDPEDTRLIRDLITSTDKDTAENTQEAFKRPDPLALKVLANTLTSEIPKDRIQALGCFNEYISYARNQDLDQYGLQFAQLLADPDPAVSKHAIELIEKLPESAAPAIAQHLTTSTDPETLDSVINSIKRMYPAPKQLIPALAQVSMNPSIPLNMRLDAADTYFRVRRGAHITDQPLNMWPAYDSLIQTLVDEDYTTAFVIGKDIKYHFHNWTATALSRYLIKNNIAPNDLNNWFDARPAITALLTIWEPLTLDPDLPPELRSDPVTRFHKALINAANRHPRSTDIVADAADQALEHYFPDQPVP